MPFIFRSPFKQVSGPLTIANGGTGSASLSGSWTPVLSASTPPTSASLTVTRALYTKIGNLVYIHTSFTIASVGSSGAGAVYVGGLPYAGVGSPIGPIPTVTQSVNLVSAQMLAGFVGGSSGTTSQLAFFEPADDAAGAYLQYSTLTNGDGFFINGCYCSA